MKRIKNTLLVLLAFVVITILATIIGGLASLLLLLIIASLTPIVGTVLLCGSVVTGLLYVCWDLAEDM